MNDEETEKWATDLAKDLVDAGECETKPSKVGGAETQAVDWSKVPDVNSLIAGMMISLSQFEAQLAARRAEQKQEEDFIIARLEFRKRELEIQIVNVRHMHDLRLAQAKDIENSAAHRRRCVEIEQDHYHQIHYLFERGINVFARVIGDGFQAIAQALRSKP